METPTRYAEWLEGFRALLRRNQRTQEEFGKAVGKSREYINSIIRGRKKAGADLQDAISHALGMSYDQVRELGRAGGGDALVFSPVANVEPAALPDRSRRVPVISFVRAGDWTEAEAVEPSWAEDWIESSVGGARVFALRVKGDSMEPVFREGEIILVDPDREAVNGDYVVAALEREEATLKRWERVGGRDLLIPLNPRYQPIDVTGQDWRVIGRVLEKRQIF